MPRYFFDLIDGEVYRDEHGMDLQDLGKVREEAARALADTAREDLPYDGNRRHIRLEVRDEAGEVVMQVSLTFLVDPPV